MNIESIVIGFGGGVILTIAAMWTATAIGDWQARRADQRRHRERAIAAVRQRYGVK